MSLAYLFDSNIQFQDKSGNNNVNGFLRVYIDNTDDRAVTYKDFNGTLNQADIRLDNNGRAVVIVDDSKTYRLEVYGTNGVLLWTLYPISPKATGINETLEALVAAVKSHTIAIEGLALGKKNKQQAKVISGTPTQTVKSFSQNADGEITVEFEDIDFPYNINISSPDDSIEVGTPVVDPVRKEETIPLSVKHPGLVKAYSEDTEAGTLIDKLEIKDNSTDPDWQPLLEVAPTDHKVAINEDNLREAILGINNSIDGIIKTIDEMDVDSVPRAYLHSTLNRSAGDSVTTSTPINVFAQDALEGDCFEFEQTTTIDDTPFGYVWIEPGTYLINAAVTLQWVGSPRGTFIAKVGSVMGENFDFSQEQEIKRNTTRVVTIPSRTKLAVNVTYDAGTPVMDFWIQSMQVVKLAGGMSQTNIIHDSTLTGQGSVVDPLGVTPAAFGKIKDIELDDIAFTDGYGVIAMSGLDDRPIGTLDASPSQSATDFIAIPNVFDGVLVFLECVRTTVTVFGLCFYDSRKSVISGIPHPTDSEEGTRNRTVEIPVNAAFVRFSCTTTEKANFFAKVTSKIKIDVDGLDEKIDNQYKLIDIGSDVSFTDGKFVIATSDAGTLGSLRHSEYQSASDYIKIPTITNGILQYMNGVYASSDLACGLVFYDADYTAISGVLEFRGSSVGAKENVVEIPNGAVYFRCTIPTAYKTEFFANVMTILYHDVKESQKGVENLQSIVEANATGAEPSPQDCWNRFGVAVDEKCKFLGITGQRVFGPSGYGTVSWNTENDEQGRAYFPIYAVCKWMAASLQYEILSNIFSCDSYVIKPLGAEPAINISSSLKSSNYSSNLLDYYNILSWKGGTEGNVSMLEAVTVCVPSCDGAVFSAVIRKAGPDGEGDNRYLAMKVLLDIACAKYENRSADVSSLETDLLATSVTNAMVILTPKGCGSAFLGRVDVTNSDYMLYNYGGATSEICTMSTTKVLTAETVLDYITNLDEYVTVLSEDIAAAAGGTYPLFTVGEKVTYRQLLYALLIRSSNEAGYILARCVGKKLLETYRGNGFLPVI